MHHTAQRTVLALAATSLLLLLAGGCGDDALDPPIDAGADSGTDAGTVSFAADVLPIINSNGCAGCHGGNGGLVIGTDPSISLINVEGTAGVSAGCETAATVRVSPGNAEASILFLRVDGRCEQRMPLGGSLNQVDIDTIRDWINQGANP